VRQLGLPPISAWTGKYDDSKIGESVRRYEGKSIMRVVDLPFVSTDNKNFNAFFEYGEISSSMAVQRFCKSPMAPKQFSERFLRDAFG